ncbi:MFS transporter [Gryllotalpicola ginsengisoli]|uniref:MFS transporter n=1 Tax=Gryllotalpicola ginsengisoli TaxID=444608 RepID=UPI0003B490D0|nr:MFS transporter [Gryllotalpicola ginsengisoli]
MSAPLNPETAAEGAAAAEQVIDPAAAPGLEPDLDPTGDRILGQKQGRWFLPIFVLAWFGANLCGNTIGGASIPRALAVMDNATKSSNLAIVAGIGGVVVMIITPLFGRLSDRTRSRFGIRRPWMLWGTVVAAVGIVILALSTNLPMVILGWCVSQVGFGAVAMAQHALLADQIPKRIRARVAAAASVAAGVATIVGTQLVALTANSSQWLWFVVPGAIGIAFELLLLVGLRDIVRTGHTFEPLDLKAILSSYWLSPSKYRDFAFAWFCRLFFTISMIAMSVYLLYFITDHLGVPLSRASGVQAQAVMWNFVGLLVSTVLFAWISDKTGRRKVIVWVSCAVAAGGLLLAIAAPGEQIFLISALIIGVGNGAYSSVDVAMMTEVLPDFKNAGKDLGVVALSYQLPQIIVPVMAVPILAIGGGDNYAALWIAAIIAAVLGAIAVLPVRKVR